MLVTQERDGNNLAHVTYTRGNDLSVTLQGAGGIGGLLARTDHGRMIAGDPSAHAYYHCDGNGSVTALVDTNGVVVARYQYDPYGNLLGMSGPMAEANTYRFSSKEWCANAGLYYYGFRYYEPKLQRWLNQDPLGEFADLNLYRFNYNNAVNFLDPDGLWGVQIGGINFGWGDPTYDFDGVDWTGYWGDVGDTLAGEAKGAVANLSFGLYTPCYTSELQKQGGWVGDSLATAGQLATGVSGLAKGATRGAFRQSVKAAYEEGRSMAWDNVRRRMLRRGMIDPNEPVHHWLFHQASNVPDSIKNLPFNLMPITKAAHKAAHSGNAAKYLWYGTPGWAKETVAGFGYAAGSQAARTGGDGGSGGGCH